MAAPVLDEGERKPVGLSTVRKELRFLRALCAFAKRRKFLTTNPTGTRAEGDGLTLPKLKDVARPVFDTARMEKLTEAAPKVRSKIPAMFATMLAVMEGSGRRIGAVRQLRWDDWRPDLGKYGELRWRSETDKTGKEAWRPVPASVAAALAVHPKTDPLIFPSPLKADRPVTYTTCLRWLRDAEKAAGLERITRAGWHAGRRGFATARKGHNLVDLAAAGGWSKGSAALVECYVHADQEAVERVILEPRRFAMPTG